MAGRRSKALGRDALDRMRVEALENNVIWLKSFGCEVRRSEERVFVYHPELTDYQAWLIYGGAERAAAAFEDIRATARADEPDVDIYVEEESLTERLSARLADAGFNRALASVTVGGLLAPAGESHRVTLRPAEAASMSTWAGIYSRGFGRDGAEADVDRERWLRASGSAEHVHNWFIVEDGSPIGVVQTCSAVGITGIYSFTLVPSRRSLGSVRGALSALRSMITRNGAARVYFDLLLKGTDAAQPRARRGPFGLAILRRMVGWQRPA